MNELNNVILIKDYKNLKKGTCGTIGLKYNEQNFEVEFFGENMDTIDVYTISSEYLKLDEN